MRLRTGIAMAAVLLACTAGGLLAMWSWSTEKRLSVERIELSTVPFHAGALDVYVPLVDWGVRFPGVRMPARLRLELRTVDRRAAAAVAGGSQLPVSELRAEGRDAIAAYLRVLAALAAGGALILGVLLALVLRARAGARLGWLLGTAALGAVAWGAAVAFLLPPRGPLDRPEYYARGSDIPVALSAVEAASRSADRLGEELDSQLVGLARLVQAPAQRPRLRGLPRLTVASDLHNNVVALPTLARAAAGRPILFPGDLTDSGTPVEASVTRRVLAAGHPFVFTAGNHDSDTSMRRLARAGAIVLTQRGRLLPGHRAGPVVARVAGVRIAGYTSPNVRRRTDDYVDRGATITREQQADFLGWLEPLVGKVDVVMVHEPSLAAGALRVLHSDPPARPLLLVVGHTHRQSVDSRDGVTVVNGGTVGAGGTGNLTEDEDIGVAAVAYRRAPFTPLAIDLVRIDPGSGSASAQRLRLGEGPVSFGQPRDAGGS